MFHRAAFTVILAAVLGSRAFAQTNPLWHEEKTKNYLPHMSWPEVRDLLERQAEWAARERAGRVAQFRR